jgi:peptide/nickel transport system substrate-binding protein
MSCAPGAPQPSGSGEQPARPSSAPKRIVAAISGEPKVLSNRVSNAGAGGIPGLDALELLINAGAARMEPDGQLHPQLAEQVPTTENGLWRLLPEGRMETTWTIKRGASWQDGTPLTAADLAFTLQASGDREVPLFYDVASDSIESVEVVDDRTLAVRWRRPFVDANTLFTSLRGRGLPLPKHVLQATWDEGKSTFADAPYFTDEFVGLGPYKVREWSRGDRLVLAANDGYLLGRPKIDTVEVLFVLDANTLAAKLLAGDVDLTMGRGFTEENAIPVRDQWQAGKMVINFESWDGIYPQFLNPNPPIIADVRFRRAMMHAVDRQKQVDNLMSGLVTVAHTHLSPNAAEYKAVEPSLVKYEYDPQKATQAIEELGYTKGADGTFRDASGSRLTVEIRAATQTDTNVKSMLATADDWQRIGVAVDQVTIPTQRAPDREYRATMPGFELTRQGNDVNTFTRYHSSLIPLPENNFTGVNRARYRSAELDELIERYSVTIPTAERTQVLAQALHHTTEQLVAMGIFYATRVTMVNNRLLNITTGDLANASWAAEQWDVK